MEAYLALLNEELQKMLGRDVHACNFGPPRSIYWDWPSVVFVWVPDTKSDIPSPGPWWDYLMKKKSKDFAINGLFPVNTLKW